MLSLYLKMLKRLLKNTLLVLVLATYCRIVFYILNKEYFSGVGTSEFFYGVRFDLVAIGYLFSGFYFVSILPFKNQQNKVKRVLKFVFFQVGLNAMLLANFIDSIYYNFTFKRSTGDVFTLVGTGNDVQRLLPQFLKDFWYVVVLYVLSVFLFTKVYKKINKYKGPEVITGWKGWGKRLAGFVLGVGLLLLSARGGIQLRPIIMADAPRYTSGANVAVLVNTPFSILLTFQNPGVKRVDYYSSEVLKSKYSPAKTIKGQGGFEGSNVVLIILESFGEEYVGVVSGEKSYTPFLDSLLNHAFIFKNNRANGLRSIEVLPSLFAGLPSLMNTPFILSPYASSKIRTLPSILRNKGYNTSFYHAGETGTMAFDAFCKNAGIENYYGLEDYPDREKDFDGAWGIYDEPYLQYFGRQLNATKQPFFSSVFTLSSHHPYSIPKQHEGRFPKGNLNVHETIGYTDYALRQFFNSVKSQGWFENTLFVITADHPAQSIHKYYKRTTGRYKVPLAFYDPKGRLKGTSGKVAKHADVPNTVLGLLGDSVEVLNFGDDLFASSAGFSMNYKNNYYISRNKDFALLFDNVNPMRFYAAGDSLWTTNLIDNDSLKAQKDSLLNFAKAYIQQYNNRLIENRLVNE